MVTQVCVFAHISSLLFSLSARTPSSIFLPDASTRRRETVLISKWGTDHFGQVLSSACARFSLSTVPLPAPSPPSTTGFTYILVSSAATVSDSGSDTSSKSTEPTRTCIHSPGVGSLLLPSDLAHLSDRLLLLQTGAARLPLVLLDGRHADAARALLDLLLERQLFPRVLLDCEKVRPGAEWASLLPAASVLVSSSQFPLLYSDHISTTSSLHSKNPASISDSDSDLLSAAVQLLDVACPSAVAVIVTLGARGSLLLLRRPFNNPSDDDADPVLHSVTSLEQAPVPPSHPAGPAVAPFAIADRSDISLLRCSSWIPRGTAVVDTTGAGDAFIGAIGVALVEGLCACRALRWASFYAGFKCVLTDVALLPAPPADFLLGLASHCCCDGFPL